ncbi:Dipeptidyl aminopeptidase/acylaminoacyl peptidase [Flagellimonas taeanensis]|uniref:Dipeptidyl aminopeptidase/acylaminoacyl peptidase n=1 Tax=Flagellimonas taeanensis TaxID=1005926 RepID=A0A1M6W4U8_9FLAO|nr:prolyl oligopeptidase family serine peptidase [Allomuricauda taeanensis]SFC46378.1 Dipeptidyl aminopeptidase/acylaminoacyl peptidase [Allomuricauda taeanensis]SHK88515.1 Dipeptidyl aminopeptidase/acylaminoacyl peptidase [Allomuricauda taeanensis]
MRKHYLVFLALLAFGWGQSQEKLTYQQPPEEILELVNAPTAPSVLIDDDGEHMLLLYSDYYKTIAELSETELRLAGLRINPKTNIGSRTNYYNNIIVKKIGEKDGVQVDGLPQNPRLSNLNWSPDQSKMAFTNTTSEGVEVMVLDVETAKATKLTDANVNANMRDVINWFKDGESLLIKMLPSDRKPLIDVSEAVPDGPTISANDGKKAQNRTYQDLLKNPNDEFNFEQLARSELYKVKLDGSKTKWKETDMYTSISFSPDGNYVMTVTLDKPFSYLVPYYRFPNTTNIFDKDGKLVKKMLEIPLIEDLPQGFMAERTGMRDLSWRNDKPATLVYVEALDGGDPQNEVPYRDEIFELEAPFNGQARTLLKTKNRFSWIQWGNDDIAIAHDRWWNDRNTKTYLFDPSNPEKEPKIISDRNYQDVYSDPGNFISERNENGSWVLSLDKNNNAYLLGDGYTEEGQFPFVEKMDLTTLKKTRLYTSKLEGKLERLIEYDPQKDQLLVRIESPNEYPNYYYKSVIRRKGAMQLTAFENPYQSIQNVHKEVITYKRDDGLELTGTLYLPVGYDMQKKEKMPMILWAYPREFKDKNSASQNTQNPNEFTYPYWGSPIYWVTRGYVVLDDASFPIIGEGDEQPNDTFRSQLVANAKAAIDAVDAMGYIDTERVAVGGHSYGAFMVANLLSHSDLFAAGIARSGAYNRTLTPFGFQSEERNYWEAPEVYYTMSPFMHSEKMKTPLLLVHGEADNNSGTYPMQSERYFNALKGLGATVRLVMLPKESHGYRAKESILHLLWEQDQWLEKYVKQKKEEEQKTP